MELSANQQQFVQDAEQQDLFVDYEYSGRGMYGKEYPAVRVNGPADFRTSAHYKTDSMGRGIIIYASR